MEQCCPDAADLRVIRYPGVAVSRLRRCGVRASECALAARVAAGERDQPDVPGSLDSHGQRSLMPCTRTKLSSRFDLAAFANVAPQTSEILVIDVPDVIDAEGADLAPRRVTTATAAAPRPTRARAAIAAFTRRLGAAEATAASGRTISAPIISLIWWAISATLSLFNHCWLLSVYSCDCASKSRMEHRPGWTELHRQNRRNCQRCPDLREGDIPDPDRPDPAVDRDCC